jgi:hypothetical protein
MRRRPVVRGAIIAPPEKPGFPGERQYAVQPSVNSDLKKDNFIDCA